MPFDALILRFETHRQLEAADDLDMTAIAEWPREDRFLMLQAARSLSTESNHLKSAVESSLSTVRAA
jgi:hypothetical protein